jgi:hypothetical protein
MYERSVHTQVLRCPACSATCEYPVTNRINYRLYTPCCEQYPIRMEIRTPEDRKMTIYSCSPYCAGIWDAHGVLIELDPAYAYSEGLSDLAYRHT